MGLISDFRKKLALINEIQDKFNSYPPGVLMEIMSNYNPETEESENSGDMKDINDNMTVIEFVQYDRKVDAILDASSPRFASFHVTVLKNWIDLPVESYTNRNEISKAEWLFQSVDQIEYINRILRSYSQYQEYMKSEKERVSEKYKPGMTFRDTDEDRFLVVTKKPVTKAYNPIHWTVPTAYYYFDNAAFHGIMEHASLSTYRYAKPITKTLLRNVMKVVFDEAIEQQRGYVETEKKLHETLISQMMSQENERYEEADRKIKSQIEDFETALKEMEDLLKNPKSEEK